MKRVASDVPATSKVGMSNPTADLVTPLPAKLPGRSKNSFEPVSVDGEPPTIPFAIDDDAPSNGIMPGPFGNTDPNTGRSLIPSLAEEPNWKT